MSKEDPLLRDSSSDSDEDDSSRSGSDKGSDSEREREKERIRRREKSKVKRKPPHSAPTSPQGSSARIGKDSARRKELKTPETERKPKRGEGKGSSTLDLRRASQIQKEDEEDEERVDEDEDDSSSSSSSASDESSESDEESSSSAEEGAKEEKQNRKDEQELESRKSKKSLRDKEAAKKDKSAEIDPEGSRSKARRVDSRRPSVKSSPSSSLSEKERISTKTPVKTSARIHRGESSAKKDSPSSSEALTRSKRVDREESDVRKRSRKNSNNSSDDAKRDEVTIDMEKGEDGESARKASRMPSSEKIPSLPLEHGDDPQSEDDRPTIDSPRAFGKRKLQTSWIEETGDAIALDPSVHLPDDNDTVEHHDANDILVPTFPDPNSQGTGDGSAESAASDAPAPSQMKESLSEPDLHSSRAIRPGTPTMTRRGSVTAIETPTSPLAASVKNIPPPPLPQVLKSEEQVGVLQAHTTLLLPFTWADPTNAKAETFINPLLLRTFVDRNGERVPLWRVSNSAPPQVADLDRRFRLQLGFDHAYVKQVASDESQQLDDRAADIVWRLALTSEVIETFFKEASLECYSIDSSAKPQLYEKRVSVIGVTMAVFPYGTATIQFHFDWLPKQVPKPKSEVGKKSKDKSKKPPRMTLEEFRALLYLVKFRDTVPGVFRGWNFGPRNKVKNWENEYHHTHISSLGSRLAKAIYEGQPLTMRQMMNWLLIHSKEDPDAPLNPFINQEDQRINPLGDERRSYHHTSVVIERKLKGNSLQQFLFYLRRAKGQINRPPVDDTQLDKVLQLRRNRFVGVSREGIASISWPTTKRKDDFELTGWPMHFHTIYRVLAVFVHGERTTLAELSHLSALAGEKLKLVSTKTSLDSMAKGRKELLALVAIMARYTLQMSSDDCGGMSDYVEFFTACRRVFKIKETRKELNSELTDVLRLVESNFYLEERAARKEQKARDDLKQMRRNRFDVLVGVLTAITLPTIVIGGLFGMNNDNLPTQVDFWWLLGGSLVFSIFLAIIFVLLVDPLADRRRQKEEEERKQKRKAQERGPRVLSRMSAYMKKPFNRLSAYRTREEVEVAGEEVVVDVNEMPNRRYSNDVSSYRGRGTVEAPHETSELDSSEAARRRRKIKRSSMKYSQKASASPPQDEGDTNGAEDGMRRRGAIDEERPVL